MDPRRECLDRARRIDDLVNILGAEAVLGAILHEAAVRVDHEDALACVSVLLVDDDDAGREASAIKEIGGQADDALDIALADKGAADVGLRGATKKDAVRQNARAFAPAFLQADDMPEGGVVA